VGEGWEIWEASIGFKYNVAITDYYSLGVVQCLHSVIRLSSHVNLAGLLHLTTKNYNYYLSDVWCSCVMW